MATADPNYFATIATIASTSYPAATAPSVNAATQNGGRWSIYNPSVLLSIYVSFDGTNDAVIIPPATPWTDPSNAGGARLWLKLSAAGSVDVTCNLVSRKQEG